MPASRPKPIIKKKKKSGSSIEGTVMGPGGNFPPGVIIGPHGPISGVHIGKKKKK